METEKKDKLFSFTHILLGCRLDAWLHLLAQNHFRILPRRIPQALLITAASLILFPFALIERLLLAVPVSRQRPREPLFIMGHWRSGTTFLINLLSRDPRFGFFTPVTTITGNNALLFRPILTRAQKRVLPGARPMDNLEYRADLPMEEIYAVANSSTLALVHMLSFPRRAQRYLDTAFVETLPEKDRRRWEKLYCYAISRQTLFTKGKPLVLKSPDNTCRAALLHRLYPDARFLHIYRDPYAVIPSTINMFCKMMGMMTFQKAPSREYMEDAIIDVFRRVYQTWLADLRRLPPERVMEIRYEDFEKTPLEHLREIYKTLGLPDFQEAELCFSRYLDEQASYRKNSFTLSPELIKKINQNLGFYFEHYGYPMRSTPSEV
ncbi:MAG: sulfotransferase [Bacillota bacterium]|nr:sulfotransferase [Bacillota bacterium]